MKNALAAQPDFDLIISALVDALSNDDASTLSMNSGDPIVSISDVLAMPHTCNDQRTSSMYYIVCADMCRAFKQHLGNI